MPTTPKFTKEMLEELGNLKFEVKIKPENLIPRHTTFTDRGECLDCLVEEETQKLANLINY